MLFIYFIDGWSDLSFRIQAWDTPQDGTFFKSIYGILAE